MDPAVLYNRLFSFHELTELLERSSTDHISWPLVSYCDDIWNSFFGSDGPKIFYSVTSVHNYSILPFSKLLTFYVRDLLPSAVIDALTADRELYCLQLASSEDANLPLYANIGHEFGHAIFDHREAELVALLNSKLASLLPQLDKELQGIDASQSARRYRRMAVALVNIAQELFCDLIGGILMGSAFFLSLYEISWGQNKAGWNISLSPNDGYIRAYPSFHFRLHCLKHSAKVDEFCNETGKELARLNIPALKELADSLATIPVFHDTDGLNVFPTSDSDSGPIGKVIRMYLPDIKKALAEYTEACDGLVRKWYSLPIPSSLHHDVAELIQRLEHKILPSIIPDGTLLGKQVHRTKSCVCKQVLSQNVVQANDSLRSRHPANPNLLRQHAVAGTRLGAMDLARKACKFYCNSKCVCILSSPLTC
ncbi:MAG: hypothetical protein ABI614_08070 [Planctomycetota bacterium]